LTYQMVAERGNETIRSARASALIAVTKARIFIEKGWKPISPTKMEEISNLGEFHLLPAVCPRGGPLQFSPGMSFSFFGTVAWSRSHARLLRSPPAFVVDRVGPFPDCRPNGESEFRRSRCFIVLAPKNAVKRGRPGAYLAALPDLSRIMLGGQVVPLPRIGKCGEGGAGTVDRPGTVESKNG
jgi:hypothetical protein